MNKVNIFVSSTCYDLSQVRIDISDFIISLGHQPFLSDFDNFPINPNQQTTINCINNIKNEADIFILIIGSRYGSILSNGYSITNTEFLAAKNKGIPIYIFIDKKVLTALSFWKTNKDGDFKGIVDNVQIFEFIQDIRENYKLWTFEFEKVQGVISTLKTQLSYLFKESLNLRTKLSLNKSPVLNLPISNNALNIILEKEEYFEISFLAQTLVDELCKYENLKNDYTYGILLQTKVHIDHHTEIINWILHRNRYIINLVNSVTNLFKNPLKIYYGDPGVSSDLKGLYYVSRTYGEIFKSLIQWTIETASTNVPEECLELRHTLSKISSELIKEMWDYPFHYYKLLEDWRDKSFIGVTGKDLKFDISLRINEETTKEFNKALEKFSQNYLKK